MNCKTEGIVIKRSNFGEADRILTIFTRRFGKVKAIAKGVRKGRARLAGHLEPFMLLDLQLFEGKAFYTVTGASIVREFLQLHNDLEKIAATFYLGELIDKFLAEGQKSEEIFELTVLALEALEKEADAMALRIFEFQVLKQAGFGPEVWGCVHCKIELVSDGEYFWDSVEGGVICRQCQTKYQHGVPFSNSLIKFFRLIDRGEIETIQKLKVDSEFVKKAEEILTENIRSILGTKLLSKNFQKIIEEL